MCIYFYFYFYLYNFKDFIHLFFERGREGERERNINVWLPLVHPLLGTWPKTQACALTGDQTATLWFTVLCSIHWATLARAVYLFFKVHICGPIQFKLMLLKSQLLFLYRKKKTRKNISNPDFRDLCD